jgi:hypothetical protein
MGTCQTVEFFEENHDLLKAIANENLILKEEAIMRVTELVQRWQSIECPGGRCLPPCPYAKPGVYWIESYGYPNLYELIYHLDPTEKIRKIPRAQLDALDAKWARMPGHYGG